MPRARLFHPYSFPLEFPQPLPLLPRVPLPIVFSRTCVMKAFFHHSSASVLPAAASVFAISRSQPRILIHSSAIEASKLYPDTNAHLSNSSYSPRRLLPFIFFPSTSISEPPTSLFVSTHVQSNKPIYSEGSFFIWQH